MVYTTQALALTVLVVRQALATNWIDAASFPCPNNTVTHCSLSQEGGYDWSDLQTGAFTSYGSNSFAGFTCSEFFGKQNPSREQAFSGKWITSNLDDSPSMFCSNENSFSIDRIRISSSHDVEIECHYAMPDGSNCNEVHACSPDGSIFENVQCGGARSVTFKPGKNAPRGCSIGVYSIGFHCASSIVPTVSSTLYTLTSYDMASSSSWSMARCRDGSCHTSAARSGPVPAPSASVQACPGGHCPATGPVVTSHVSGGSLSTTSFVQNVSISPMSASLSSCHASLCPSSMPWENARTSYPEQSSGCYGSTCSVRASATASYHSLNSGTRSTSADSTSMVVPGPASVQTSYLASNCPDLLPRCLNTWITMSECMNNSDSNCFCGKESYIENVMGCIGAWSTSDEEADVAASYLMGICTAHVPANPAIITAYSLPSQLGPLRATHTVAASRTTITFTAILIVALTQSTGTCAGLPIPGSSYTAQLVKTVTVPAFQRATSTITIAGHTTACVGLGAGTASSVTAHSTGAASSTSMASHPRVIASGGLYGTVNRTASATGLTATNAKSSLFISPVIGGGQKVVFEFINLAVGALAALAVL